MAYDRRMVAFSPRGAALAPEPADHRSVLDWLEAWARCVRAVDYAAARPFFSAELVAFGTHEGVMHGLDDVEARQWCAVWPRTRGFRFRTEGSSIRVSGDRRLAVVMAPWESLGLGSEGGADFPRPGRATIVLERDAVDAPWRGIHTHFSLRPHSEPTRGPDPEAPTPRG